MPRTNRFSLSRLVCRFRRQNAGAVAVEFALLLPLMLTIWVGMTIATDALKSNRKVTVLTRTLSDLTTQFSMVSQSDLDSIFAATGSILWPNPVTNLGMRLTSIDVDGAGVAWIDWSGVPTDSTLRGSFAAQARCTKVTDLPAGLLVARSSLVMAETTLKYQASIATQLVDEIFAGVFSGGFLPMGDKLYMRPRQVNKVSFSPAPNNACPGYVP